MKTGLTKTQKTTEIWFNEKEPTIHVRTHNTDLKKRLTAYTEKFPTECRLIDDDPELGSMEFEITKGRLSFSLTEPYSEERRQRASEYAKKKGLKGGEFGECPFRPHYKNYLQDDLPLLNAFRFSLLI